MFTRLKLWLCSAKQLCKWLYGFSDLFCLNDSAQFANQIKADFSNCHSCAPSRNLQSQLCSLEVWRQRWECCCLLVATLVPTKGRRQIGRYLLDPGEVREQIRGRKLYYLEGEKADSQDSVASKTYEQK